MSDTIYYFRDSALPQQISGISGTITRPLCEGLAGEMIVEIVYGPGREPRQIFPEVIFRLGELWDQYYIARSELNAARNKAARPAVAPFTAYFNTAGEVESRNVQRRLNMTAEERQNSLLSETEDVAEESKIYLFEGGESLMAEPFTEDQKQKILAMAPGMAGVRFAIDEKPYYQIPFADSVDAVINDTYTGNGSVFMRDTPKLFVEMGFSKLPIMTTAKHIKSIYSAKQMAADHNHDLGELIKQIPEKLENPLMVITSETHPDTSVVVILELTDKNGDAIVVPILLNGRSDQNRIDAHIMTSAQGRENAFSKLAKNAVIKENGGVPSVLYAQKNAESILNAEGVQFPNRYAFDSVNHNITDVGLKVKPQTETLQFKNWFKNSKVVDQDGKPLVVYHQTGAVFTVFDTNRSDHSKGDFETPIGIFLKPSDNDIGFSGKKQMALYAKITNPKVFQSRMDLLKFGRQDARYAEIVDKIEQNDLKYHEINEKLDAKLDEFYIAWRKKQRESGTLEKADIELDEEYNKLQSAVDENITQWGNENNELGAQARKILTDLLKNQGYDGVIIKKDTGSFGRTTETFIVFEPTQIKSATDNVGTFDPANPDIRFSIGEEGAENANGRAVRYLQDGNKIIPIAEGFNFDKTSDMQKAMQNYISLLNGEHFTIKEDNTDVYFDKTSPTEYAWSNDTKNLRNRHSKLFKAKAKAVAAVGSIIENASGGQEETTKVGHSKENKKGMFRRYDVEFGLPSGTNEVKVYTGELIVWVPETGNSTFYDITHIKFSRKVRDTTNVADSTGPRFENEETPHQLPAADNNIPQNPENASDTDNNLRFSVAPEEGIWMFGMLRRTACAGMMHAHSA